MRGAHRGACTVVLTAVFPPRGYPGETRPLPAGVLVHHRIRAPSHEPIRVAAGITSGPQRFCTSWYSPNPHRRSSGRLRGTRRRVICGPMRTSRWDIRSQARNGESPSSTQMVSATARRITGGGKPARGDRSSGRTSSWSRRRGGTQSGSHRGAPPTVPPIPAAGAFPAVADHSPGCQR